MKWFRSSEIRASVLFSIFSLVFSLVPSPAFAQFGGGGGGGGGPQPPAPGPLPPATIAPLPFEGPAPWGVDPATQPGIRLDGAPIKGNGFLQETIVLQNGTSFFFQDIKTSDFSSQSYVKGTTAQTNNPTGQTNNPEGNLIFNQTITDPAWGLTDHTFMNGFKQPIQMHFDIVESKVAKLTGGFNQMDMHFRQIPFIDTATGRVRTKQDIGVWITSFAGLLPDDITQSEAFTTPGGSHTLATTVPSGGGFGGRRGGSSGIDFWNDLQAVKITDAATKQIVTFSRCNDFGDPNGRLEGEFREDLGSRGGCFKGPVSAGRPGLPDHSSDDFQLTPLNWERWGGNGAAALNSGISTRFPGSGAVGDGGRR